MVSVSIAANAQVEVGAPLLRLRTTQTGRCVRPRRQRRRPGIDLAGLAERTDFTRKPCERVYGPLGNYLLGYDLRRGGAAQAADRAAPARPRSPLRPTRRCWPARTGCSTSTPSSARSTGPRTEDEPDELALHTENTQEYFVAFLQWLDADRAGLPDGYRDRLERALGRFGVSGLDAHAGARIGADAAVPLASRASAS